MPYAPGISYRGDQYLSQGISSAGDSLSAAITNIGQEKKSAKAMQAMFDAMTPEPDVLSGEVKPHPLGMNADQFKSMSWKDQIAKMGGFIRSVSVKSALAEVARAKQAAADEQATRTATQGFMAELGQLSGAPADGPAGIGAGMGMLFHGTAATESGGPAFAGVMASQGPLGDLAAMRGPDTTEAPIREPGAPGAGAKGGRLDALLKLASRHPQASPQAVNALAAIAERLDAAQERNADRAGSEGPPQILPGPFPTTRIVTDARGRGTPQVIHDPAEKDSSFEVAPVFDPITKELTGYGLTAKFRDEAAAQSYADKQRKAMLEQRAGDIVPLPKDQKQWKDGVVYQTAKGPGRWNARTKQFEKVK